MEYFNMSNKVALSIPRGITWMTPDEVMDGDHLYDHHVNVYKIDRRFGGPEEGDWYFDSGTLVSDDLFSNLELATEYAKKIQKELESSDELPYEMGTGPNDGLDPNGDPDDNYIQRGGSWGTGSYQINVERKVGANYPTETPRWD